MKFVFHSVGMLFSGCVPHSEWGPNEKRECVFVIIGKHLEQKWLEDHFKAAAVEDKPLFGGGFLDTWVYYMYQFLVWFLNFWDPLGIGSQMLLFMQQNGMEPPAPKTVETVPQKNLLKAQAD